MTYCAFINCFSSIICSLIMLIFMDNLYLDLANRNYFVNKILKDHSYVLRVNLENRIN